MPSRLVAAKELADLFKVVAHPDRIRLIEELSTSERNVKELADLLSLTDTRVSQHLSLLRTHRLVQERRDGRMHFYRLVKPDMAPWIVNGLAFLESRINSETKSNIESARRIWAGSEDGQAVNAE